MANKKCPKCGEENPAEAVMCWACYTPLAGGAAAVAGGGLVAPRGGVAAVTPAATAAAAGEGDKKAIDPKIFLIIGLLVGAIIIGGFTTGMFKSSSTGIPESDFVLPENNGNTVGGDIQPAPQPQPQPRNDPGSNPGVTDPVGPVTPPVAPEFKIVVPPDPRYSNGTVAIMPNREGLSPAQAGELARSAKQAIAPGGKWTTMQILVFNNTASAKAFQSYQGPRKGARLNPSDYQALANSGVWSGVSAYLETKGRSDNGQLLNPSSNPNGWWGGRRR